MRATLLVLTSRNARNYEITVKREHSWHFLDVPKSLKLLYIEEKVKVEKHPAQVRDASKFLFHEMSKLLIYLALVNCMRGPLSPGVRLDQSVAR